MTNKSKKIFLLRIIHTAFSLYFISCLFYLYYAAINLRFDVILAIAFLSLAIEGFIVYILNNGDCPLVHIQNKIGDNVPFFELFLPKKIAQKAFKFFSILTWGGVLLLIIRFGLAFF